MERIPAGLLGRRPKKLIAAARRWAGADDDGAQIDHGVATALAAFGARDRDVDAARERAVEPDFEVYPENWDAVQLFLALSTQWRAVAFGTLASARVLHTGLDYTAVESVARLTGIPRSRRAAVFQQLRVMEEAALDVLLSD